MRTDFESKQSVEILWGDEATETIFEIGLKCMAASHPGNFNPIDGGEPPSGPEFDVTTITVSVPRVNRDRRGGDFLPPLVLTYEQFLAIVGEDIGERMIAEAVFDAAEKGDF